MYLDLLISMIITNQVVFGLFCKQTHYLVNPNWFLLFYYLQIVYYVRCNSLRSSALCCFILFVSHANRIRKGVIVLNVNCIIIYMSRQDNEIRFQFILKLIGTLLSFYCKLMPAT